MKTESFVNGEKKNSLTFQGLNWVSMNCKIKALAVGLSFWSNFCHEN